MPDEAHPVPASLSGETLLGRYRVDRRMGGGGMATVYLGEDLDLGTPIVVKVPHGALLAEPGFRERFEQETADLIALQHPHIVRILARGEHAGLPFLVLPFLKGGSLGDRMRRAGREGLAYDTITPWLRDAAQALDYIHGQGIVHRDIKPDNVLFDEHGYVYLSDFGIAKAMGGVDTGLTATGTTPGSPAYMAPEQPRTSALTGASDQYALAASLYEALSGRPTYEGETFVDVLIKKQSEDPVSLRSAAPEVPVHAAGAIMRALARTPEDRFATCADLVEAMTATSVTGPTVRVTSSPSASSSTSSPAVTAPADAPTAITSSPPPPAAPLAAPPRRTRRVWLLVLLVAAMAAVVLAVVWSPGDEPKAPSAFVGTYVLDRALLKARLARRPLPRPRTPLRGRMKPGDLERLMKLGVGLTVKPDGTFELILPRRGLEGTETISGSWREAGDQLFMRPEAGTSRPELESVDELRARLVPQGIVLLRRGSDIPLRRATPSG